MEKEQTILVENNIKLLLGPHDRPKSFFQWSILALQHVFAMFGSTVLVPLIINQTAGVEVMNIAMALFCSGVGTLIYIAITAAKVPMYLGSSFAYMGAMGVCYPLYGNAVFIAVMMVGVIYITFGILVYFIGNKFLERILPAVIVGPLIIIIGMSVAPSAINNAGFNPDAWKQPYSHWIGIGIAVFTFLITAIIALKCKGFAKVVPVIIGVVAGYLLCVILHFAIGTEYQILDTSKITDPSQWQWYPSFKKIWDLKASNIGPAILAISPLAIIAIAEHIGDHISMGQMTGKNFVKDPGMHRTLIADGVSIIFDGLVGGPANTTYGENASVVGMTRIASVWVTGLAALFAIGLSFIAPVNQLVQILPAPVMGGISMIMFGLIATNGIRVLINNQIDYTNMKNVFVTAIMLVLGLGGAIFNFNLGTGNLQFTGVALAAFAGIFLNLLLPDHQNNGFQCWKKLKLFIKTQKEQKREKKRAKKRKNK
ncbi:uracil-xanthine permease family protein [Spiroplasma melliferum]|uniref:uracil-xanthine permease family protein n=1 Tax=Spiroplasma melliferum TaxID=2134 RepID=UPI0002A62AE0|nr:uracil-xanthine permease family protein [Spiroplasma melliferum]ELL44296.1 uracil permease [Spiroplasma melliferum IPMB4A]